MFDRLKSSLEKRAPSVVGALRSLRGKEAPDAAPSGVPTRVAAPVPAPAVVAAKPATVAAPVAKPVTPAPAVQPPVVAPVAPPPVVAPVAVAPPVVAPPVVAPVAPPPVIAVEATPAAVVIEPKPAASAKAAVEAKPAAKAVAEAKPAAAAKPAAKTDAHDKSADKKPKHLHADTGSTDIDAYIARAKANGRDPAQIKGGEGLNVAEDGEAYAGPLDNESSRAKAAAKLLVIDQFECISCGTCVEQTEKVFYLPADGKATPIAQEGPMDLIQDAIEACPVTCIHWVTPDEAVERGLTSGME